MVQPQTERLARGLAGTALLCLVAAQNIFWPFTYPANVATNSWMAVPENCEALRDQWEYRTQPGRRCSFWAALAAAALIRQK